jgi:hydrogenase maturation protease
MNSLTPDPALRVKVLGVGNLLWADEGFGVRCIEALDQGWEFPPGVELLDGGTLGLGLIPLLQDASHVLLFDAVDHSGQPGSLVVARNDEVPRFMHADKMSLHQASMNDVLTCLDMLGHRPEAFTVIGVKPVQLADYGGSLTDQVRSVLPEALELGLAELRRWGVEPRLRSTQPDASVVISAIGRDTYEAGRPSEEAALRTGDERFMALRAARQRARGEDAGED